MSPHFSAKLRYKGGLYNRVGIYFGVELLSGRGKGNTNGTLNKYRFVFKVLSKLGIVQFLHFLKAKCFFSLIVLLRSGEFSNSFCFLFCLSEPVVSGGSVRLFTAATTLFLSSLYRSIYGNRQAIYFRRCQDIAVRLNFLICFLISSFRDITKFRIACQDRLAEKNVFFKDTTEYHE